MKIRQFITGFIFALVVYLMSVVLFKAGGGEWGTAGAFLQTFVTEVVMVIAFFVGAGIITPQ